MGKSKLKQADGHCCTTSVGGIALSLDIITFLSEVFAVCTTLFAIYPKLKVIAEFKLVNPSCPWPINPESSSNSHNIHRDNCSSPGHPVSLGAFKSRFFDSEPASRVSGRDTGRPGIKENRRKATDIRLDI